MGKGRRTAGSHNDEVCAQKAERQWCVWAQSILCLGHFKLSHAPGSLPAAGRQMGTCTCFLYPPTVGVSGSNTGSAGRGWLWAYLGLFPKHRETSSDQWGKYLLFTLAMPLTPAKGNLDHTGGECNIQRAAGFVQLHAHDPLVFYSIIAAPTFLRQDSIIHSLSWASSLFPATTWHPCSQPMRLDLFI